MMFKSSKQASGFTLIELMVALAISIFLIGGILLMQSSSRTASAESERLSRTQEGIRFVSSFLVRELRNAGFRDQLSLTIAEFDTIGNEFAAINDDGSLTLRYSGRGTCAEGFQVGTMLESDLVTNRYFVDADTGELRCEGTNGAGTSRTVALASGIRDISFEFLCPAANPDCECRLWVHGDDFAQERERLEDSCYGIRVGLLMEPFGAGAAPVPVELSATFRNIVLGKMMWEAVPDPI